MPLKSAVQQDEVTMAQLCLDTSPIVANDTYRIDIFDASANGATAGAEGGCGRARRRQGRHGQPVLGTRYGGDA